MTASEPPADWNNPRADLTGVDGNDYAGMLDDGAEA